MKFSSMCREGHLGSGSWCLVSSTWILADVKADHGRRWVWRRGTGIASGDGRAREAAALKAITSPLLEDVTIDGARGVLMNITCGPDLTIEEAAQAASIVHEAAHEDARPFRNGL